MLGEILGVIPDATDEARRALPEKTQPHKVKPRLGTDSPPVLGLAPGVEDWKLDPTEHILESRGPDDGSNPGSLQIEFGDRFGQRCWVWPSIILLVCGGIKSMTPDRFVKTIEHNLRPPIGLPNRLDQVRRD